MSNSIIGTRQFTDGVNRTVHVDEQGRHFVVDDDGSEVYDQWLSPEEECEAPLIVERAHPQSQL
jgi:hypothetical protein